MKKFMILYMAPVSAAQQMDVSPEEMKKGMEPWLAWFKKCGKSIVDKGNPLGNAVHLTKRGVSKSESQVTGYGIIQAEDMEAAKAMVKDHPHFMLPKSSIELLEIMPMM